MNQEPTHDIVFKVLEKHYGKFTRKDRRQMMNEGVIG